VEKHRQEVWKNTDKRRGQTVNGPFLFGYDAAPAIGTTSVGDGKREGRLCMAWPSQVRSRTVACRSWPGEDKTTEA